jgi:hypothetical protein
LLTTTIRVADRRKLTGWASTGLRVSRGAASSGISVDGVEALHLQVQEIAEQDRLLAVGARTAEADHAAEAVAVSTALLAEVAGLARWALVDGVLGQRLPTAQSLSEESFLQVRERGVAQAERPLAARR